MALSEKNFYCLCQIWVYMIVSVAASPVSRRTAIISELDFFPANTTQNNSVCKKENVTYNNQDVVPGVEPCEQCFCNAPDIVCSKIKCDMKPGCKIIQKENQCCPDFKCDCEYNGKVYYNGEKIDTSDMPCRVCYCKGGDVMCTTVGCYERDDCEGKMVPGTCCPKYDHCPPVYENNNNVKITLTKMDGIIPRNGSRGLQPWPFSGNDTNVTVNPAILSNEFDATTSSAELTMVMKRINNNQFAAARDVSKEENATSEIVDITLAVQATDIAEEALNTVKIVTQPATMPTESVDVVYHQEAQESTNTYPEPAANVSQCSQIVPVPSEDLITAIFANTEMTDKSAEQLLASSTPQANDPIKALIDMEKSTMAILQQLLDVKTTIEPLVADTAESANTEAIDGPVAVATLRRIAAKIPESVTTTGEPEAATSAAIVTQQSLVRDSTHAHDSVGLPENYLTVRATVLQAENVSRHAAIDDNFEIANVTILGKNAQSDAVQNDAPAGTAANEGTEMAIVRVIENLVLNDAANLNEKETSNDDFFNRIVTVTTNVTQVDDTLENISATTNISSTAASTNATSADIANDPTETADVLLLGKNSSISNTWEDLGAVVAHVTVSYPEENKVDSDLSSSISGENVSSSETTVDPFSFSENLLETSTSVDLDKVTRVAESTNTISSEFFNLSNANAGDSTKLIGSVAANVYSNLTLFDSTDVTMLPSGPEIVPIGSNNGTSTHVNALVVNYTQSDISESITTPVSGITDVVIDVTTFRNHLPNDTGSESVDYTTQQPFDFSTEMFVSKTAGDLTTFNLLTNRSTESAALNKVENTTACTSDNCNNVTAKAEKVIEKDTFELTANQTVNEPIPFEKTTTPVIKDDGVPVITENTTSNAFVTFATTLAAPSSHNENEISATEVSTTGESTANGTPTVQPDFVDYVTFKNQIRLDVADQLPQSFFVESFLSPLNYTFPSSEPSLNNDFPFEIFFNPNLSNATSVPSVDSLNATTTTPKFIDFFNSTDFNVSTESITDYSPTDDSNYTKIFAQKIVLHPIKLFNSINSVYLSPGLGLREGTSPTTTTKESSSTEHSNFEKNNSTEPWNSTEGITTVSSETTTPVAFEDTKSVSDSSRRNMSMSNYKILLDSLNAGKVKPPTKVPKITMAPLTWLKNSPSASLHIGAVNLPIRNNENGNVENDTKIQNTSESNVAVDTTIAGNNVTTPTDQSLKNESRVESAEAKVYDPLMPYPEEYPEEYQTIQNGPAIIITRTTYTRIPNVTYTTVTMATLPTYQQVQKAEDGFAETLFERKLRERSFSNEGGEVSAASSFRANDSSTSTSTTTTSQPSSRYFNIDIKKIDDSKPMKRNTFRNKSKSSSDRRLPDPPMIGENTQKSSSKMEQDEEKESFKTPVLDERDKKIVQNFMNKHLRIR